MFGFFDDMDAKKKKLLKFSDQLEMAKGYKDLGEYNLNRKITTIEERERGRKNWNRYPKRER